MIYPQLLLDTHEELIVDLFAGGGGASTGIEKATGRQVDVAVNHCENAVAMHRANHPQTHHERKGIEEVCPLEATKGRDVGLLWASPDCTYFSKARGGKPIRKEDEQQRALAWIITRWTGQVQPRVVMMENVEEFTGWGPLIAKRDPKTGRCYKRVRCGTKKNGEPKYRREVAAPGERVPIEKQCLIPDPDHMGERFAQFVAKLERQGYEVDWRELKACDYGAPTTRKRFFLIARCDGEPIRWPEPTHAPRGSMAVKSGRKKPYRSAASCIDWDRPMASIFLTNEEAKEWKHEHGKSRAPNRPLAENTMRRIARGFWRYVVTADEPFVVPEMEKLSFISTYYGGPRRGDARGSQLEEPMRTQGTENRHALVTAQMQAYYGGETGGNGADAPLRTVTVKDRQALVCAYLTQNYGGFYDGDGRGMLSPVSTVTKSGSHRSLVAANLLKLRGTSTDADVGEPLHTVSAGGTHHALAVAHMSPMYNAKNGEVRAAALQEPLHTVTASPRHSLVAAHLMTNTSGHSGARLEEPLPTVATGGHHALVASLLQKYCGDRGSVDDYLTPEGFVAVEVAGQTYVVADIYMRMLQPRELYRANGFHDGHIIDWGIDDNGDRVVFPKYVKVGLCGNAVPSQWPEALVNENMPRFAARPELALAA